MAKKKLSSEAACDCGCCSVGCKVICGLVVAVLGLFMIWPWGWFTFNHTFGLLVFLCGLKVLWWGFRGCH